jgi:glycosyltransferase involved in cell wall biosynthesis
MCDGTRLDSGLSELFPLVLKSLPEKPSVSVLIPCFNYGAYVGEAIESVLKQTYPATEIIVSDDGSQDDSCQVVESYIGRGVGIRLLRNLHGGMASNLNAAYRSSSGEVLCLLDADDTFLPGKIEAVVNAFRMHPEAGFAIHRASLVNDRKRGRGLYPLLSPLPSGDCAQITYDNSGILMGLPPTTNLALRREVADRIFPIPVEYTGYAEQVIHRMAPLMTQLCTIDAPLAQWRLHGLNDQNATRVTAQRLERELNIMESLWQDQKQYLDRVSGTLGGSFPAIGRNPLFLKMNYTRLRLKNDPARHQAYRDMCAFGLHADSRVDWFWRYSNLLPRPLFQRAVDLLMTQGVLKEMIMRATRSRHGV